MSFEADIQKDVNKEQYKHLKSQAQRLNASVITWMADYTALRALVSADKQAELDTKKDQFIAALQSALSS